MQREQQEEIPDPAALGDGEIQGSQKQELSCQGDNRLRLGPAEFHKKLNAYLIWFEDYYNAIPKGDQADGDEIGIEDILKLNPPELDDHDIFVRRWFDEHVSSVAREFNLLPVLISRMEMASEEMTIFLIKLNMCYESHVRIIREKIDKNGGMTNA
ncbi:MAG: hypothetical protein KJ556_21390 [Gammaproteobacteria bacterium]|nr:hypothetical protein [Gammaproteobacteria bacterium]